MRPLLGAIAIGRFKGHIASSELSVNRLLGADHGPQDKSAATNPAQIIGCF